MPSVNNAYTCQQYRTGKIRFGNSKHTLGQLLGEGHKRVASFLFEQLFARAVRQALPAAPLGFGWAYVPVMHGEAPLCWYRVGADLGDWNACDDAMLSFLVDRGYRPFRVIPDYQAGSLVAYVLDQGGSWTGPSDLDKVLARVFNRPRLGRVFVPTSPIDEEAHAAARQLIGQRFDAAELASLLVSRLLINCYISPWAGRQPMDIDVCVLVAGRLNLVEFKRKYPFPPRTGDSVGLDASPHCGLVDWLTAARCALLHVVLVDPLWDDRVSPTHLLEQTSRTAPFASWMATELTTHSFVPDAFVNTSGSKSGMNASERFQRVLPVNTFRNVGRGLTPSDLGTFLNNPAVATLQPADPVVLRSLRDASRAAYGY